MTWKKAWHFVGNKLRDGRDIPKDGEWLEHDGELVMCESGLHASKRVTDALKYAPGNTICRVEVAGEILEGADKLAATRRKILWRIDGEAVLGAFARWCALQVVDKWDAPDVVLEYLSTGNESIRSAAWSAAESGAESGAGYAAESAAESAARSAAESAAWSVARSAAWDAARAATRAAARAAQEEQLLAMIDEARNGKTEWVFDALLEKEGE